VDFHVLDLVQLQPLNAHFIFSIYLYDTSSSFGVSQTIFTENLRIPTQNHLLYIAIQCP